MGPSMVAGYVIILLSGQVHIYQGLHQKLNEVPTGLLHLRPISERDTPWSLHWQISCAVTQIVSFVTLSH